MPPIQQFSAVPSDYTRLAQEQVARIRERQSVGTQLAEQAQTTLTQSNARRSQSPLLAAAFQLRRRLPCKRSRARPRRRRAASAGAREPDQPAGPLDMMQRMFADRQAALRDAALQRDSMLQQARQQQTESRTQADQSQNTFPPSRQSCSACKRSKMPSSCRSGGAATRRAATRRGTARGRAHRGAAGGRACRSRARRGTGRRAARRRAPRLRAH